MLVAVIVSVAMVASVVLKSLASMVPVDALAMTWNSMRIHWFVAMVVAPVATVAPAAFTSATLPVVVILTEASLVAPLRTLTSWTFWFDAVA